MEQAPSAAGHADQLMGLAADLGNMICQSLTDNIAMTDSMFGDPGLEKNALAGCFQYALLYCALEKCRFNQQNGDPYWKELHVLLHASVHQAASQAAASFTGPLSAVTGQDELSPLEQSLRSPLGAFQGTSLANLDRGLEKTPIEVVVKQVISRFYSKADHTQVADAVVGMSFEAIKALFTQGGLI